MLRQYEVRGHRKVDFLRVCEAHILDVFWSLKVKSKKFFDPIFDQDDGSDDRAQVVIASDN